MTTTIPTARPAARRSRPGNTLTRTSGIGLGITMLWFSLLVLIPLVAVIITASSGGWSPSRHQLTNEQTASAIKLTTVRPSWSP